MSRKPHAKRERQAKLLAKLKEDPFMTDEEIAEYLAVSIPTVRLDRLELGIPELRQRVRDVAAQNHGKVRSLSASEIIGELIELNLGQSGISVLDTSGDMVFEQSGIVRGHYIYSMAESLAIAVIDADAALVGVANIKYKLPVFSGNRLVAKASVRESREEDRYIVWVMIYCRQVEVFRGKFILAAINGSGTAARAVLPQDGKAQP